MIPRHMAIVMDGNGRWATKRGLPRLKGHHEGLNALKKIINFALHQKISVLSVFAFSTENWGRPKEEVNYLMSLLVTGLKQEVKTLHKKNIRLRVIGDLEALDAKIQAGILAAQKLTEQNTDLTLVVAINYGGQWDITQAAYRLAQDVMNYKIEIDNPSIEIFNQYLCLSDLPPVDLFIRTSGELRISNFFLWQIAYAELYFTEVLWPDFDEVECQRALTSFVERKRRFGKI